MSDDNDRKTEDAGEVTETSTPVEEPTSVEVPADKKADPVEKAAPSGQFADLIKQIEELSVLKLADLVKELEARFGVSASAPMGMVAAPAAAGSAEAAEPGKSAYTIHLVDGGAQKIAVIKAVREIVPELGLKEAKDLVDGAPKDIKKDVPKDDAEVAKTKLEAAGAKVELK
ncbi:50S ribosomal protein L7/L12 [Candidatus Berkelbacteria bacterium]|nr:50S ribosomal protein L7/L12 [Candidatus Berkelbacteria bacterium]